MKHELLAAAVQGESTWNEPSRASLFGVQFKNEIDVGHILTVVTLLAGFAWWLYTTIRSWRQKSEEDARSGALRFMLALLRQRAGVVTLADLMREFNDPSVREKRTAYCKKDWSFRSLADFESAVYRLDWEGKIDFVSPHEISFRLDRQPNRQPVVPLDEDEKGVLLSMFKASLDQGKVPAYELAGLAKLCASFAPAEVGKAIRGHLAANNTDGATRVADLIARLNGV